MKRRDMIVLNKIVQEADVIETMINGITESDFISDEMMKRAVCMTLLNIGELIKNLDSEIRTAHNKVPWKDIAGFRDVAAHGYLTLKMERVWVYAKEEMPSFASQIKEILDNEATSNIESVSQNDGNGTNDIENN